ncbi:MAG: hypothetical protein ABEJ99_02025 [Candidatus Nanohaloarchaea archaeon]
MRKENYIETLLKHPGSLDLLSVGLRNGEGKIPGKNRWFANLDHSLGNAINYVNTYDVSAENPASDINGNVHDIDFNTYSFLDSESQMLAVNNTSIYRDRNCLEDNGDIIENYVKMADTVLNGLDAVLFVDVEDDLSTERNFREADFDDVLRRLESDTNSKGFIYPMDTGDDRWILYREK